jgi:copper chaperone CopZ
MYAIEPDSPVREATVNELLIGDASGKKSHLKEGIVMPHSKDRTCYVAPIETSVDSEALKRSVKTLFRIVGMGCPTCVTRVRNSLLSAPGVLRARIDLRSGLASVDYDPTRTEKEALLDAVAAAGDGRHAYRAVLF